MKRVLCINDLSSIGQCSLAAALPVLSAAGLEPIPLPTAVLSAHTGYEGYTFRDLTDDFAAVFKHFNTLGIKFDAVYTGYFASPKQIDITLKFLPRCSLVVVDPVMADGGAFYRGFNSSHAEAMLRLCKRADVITPNLTEAAFLLGEPLPPICDKPTVERLARALFARTGAAVVITGCVFGEKMGVCVLKSNALRFIEHEIVAPAHKAGTGDLFAANLVAELTKGGSLTESVRRAESAVVEFLRK